MESISAHDLDRRLADLVRSERHVAIQFVVELSGFASRELYRELGYASLFHYCVRQLGLSKSSAFRRSEVARLIARFPAIADRLAAGRISIRALVELREVLTVENHASVLDRAEGKSQEEAQLLAVEYKPKPVPRDVVRALPTRIAPPAASGKPFVVPFAASAGTGTATTRPPGGVEPAAGAMVPAGTDAWPRPPEPIEPLIAQPVVPAGTNLPPQPPEIVKPLTLGLRRLNVTVSAEFIDELEEVRAALSHQCPDGSFERVVREAFKLVLQRDRQRKALTDRPRAQRPRRAREDARNSFGRAQRDARQSGASPSSEANPSSAPNPSSGMNPGSEVGPNSEMSLGSDASPGSDVSPSSELPQSPGREQNSELRRGGARYVPAAVKRAVWARDKGRCTWPMGDGEVCGSRHQLEFDHDLEVALGGKATVGNIRLLCRNHNLMKAEQHLGRTLMAKFRSATGVPQEPPRRGP